MISQLLSFFFCEPLTLPHVSVHSLLEPSVIATGTHRSVHGKLLNSISKMSFHKLDSIKFQKNQMMMMMKSENQPLVFWDPSILAQTQSQQTGISNVLDTVKAFPSFLLSPHFHHCIKKL